MRGPLFQRALSRLDEAERDRERRVRPYALSLHALTAYFTETGTRQGWLGPDPSDRPILIAVSGGGDSVALLWLFRTLYEGPVIAAHVHHGLRGWESDEDADFVRSRAEGWGLAFLERRAEARGRGHESLEMAARRVRYRALQEMAAECGAWGVALGHNRDDLAETVLLNLLRGTGPRGGVGIPERRDAFFRPLLGLRRAFLRQVLAVRGIPWREDRTNALTSREYTRNFLRLELMPMMEERVNAGAVEHLASFAEAMRPLREEEERRGRALLDGLSTAKTLPFSLERQPIAALEAERRALLVREAGRRFGLRTLSRRRAEELARLLGRPEGDFTFQWGQGVSVLGRGNAVWWAREEPLQRGAQDLLQRCGAR